MNARRALCHSLCGIVAVCALSAAACALAAEVTLKTAWLRPAAAGMAEAQAYVDITSDSDLELVGASTPFARKVELVLVAMKNDVPDLQVVTSMRVPAGKTTRLAYRGSHLRLVEITKSFGNGTAVPLTLLFKSPDGKEVTAAVDAQVRGLLLPQQMPAVVGKEPEPPAKESSPANPK
jgi:copper(I)-binding protein